jgi:hypothetical protein
MGALIQTKASRFASLELNRPPLKGKCFTPKDGKWKSLSETSEVKQWRATIFA